MVQWLFVSNFRKTRITKLYPPLASTCLFKRFLRFKFVAYDPVYRHPTILSAFTFIASFPPLLHIPYLSTSNSPLAPLISYMFIRYKTRLCSYLPPLVIDMRWPRTHGFSYSSSTLPISATVPFSSVVPSCTVDILSQALVNKWKSCLGYKYQNDFGTGVAMCGSKQDLYLQLGLRRAGGVHERCTSSGENGRVPLLHLCGY